MRPPKSEAKRYQENYELMREQLGELTKLHAAALKNLQLAENQLGYSLPKEESIPTSPKIMMN